MFLVLLSGVISSAIFQRFHLPWVLALIVAGVAIGPSGFELVEINPTIAFLGEIGLVFLMFMAGLETKFSTFKEFGKGIASLAIFNSLIPFGVGYIIGMVFDFGVISSLLLGVIFMSSSIAVIVPTLESVGLNTTKLGRSIVAATILEDVASLVLLSMLLQSIDPVTVLPLPSFYGLLIILLVAFRYGLPKLRDLVPRRRDEKDLFESEVRIVFMLLLGVVIAFELLGLHSIIAGFFAGLVLSDSIKSEILLDKIRTIGYGVFIPVFFIIVGLQTEIGIFTQGGKIVGLLVVVVAGSMLAKVFSGWLGARVNGFDHKEALTVGFATMPQLSTTLAVVFTAVELGLLQDELVTAMVILSVATTLVSPIAVKWIAERQV